MSVQAGREARRRRILDLIAQVPRGQVISYSELSLEVYGHPHASHVISNLVSTSFSKGGCLGWYRVVCSDGTLSPSAPFEQRRLLEAEGVVFEGEGAGARIKGAALGFS